MSHDASLFPKIEPPARILITGGSGFIGTNLLEVLAAQGHTLLDLSKHPPLKDEHRMYWRKRDLMDREGMLNDFQEFQPEYVIHLAARTDCDENTTVDESYRMNTDGTQYVAEAVKSCATIRRTIFTSSQFVCGPGRLPEHDNDYFPATVYGQSKVICEQRIRAVDPSCCWTMIRPTNIWGPWHPRYPREFWAVVKKGLYMHPGGDPVVRCYGYVGNIVWQILRILTMPEREVNRKVFYVGDEAADIYEWTNAFSKALRGTPARKVPRIVLRSMGLVGDVISKITGRVFFINSSRVSSMVTNYVTPIAKTFSALGRPPFWLEEGVRITADWLETSYGPKLRKEKFLIFAHTPPPHHGQSYMVKLTLDAFGGSNRGRPSADSLQPISLEMATKLEPYHVNCSISDRIDDIGAVHLLKLLKLLRFCLEALWCRFRHDVRTFYYVPAPGKRSALYRDWIVMAICRPFFDKIVFHWHATGLGEWVDNQASGLERSISHLLLDGADVSIVLTDFNRDDAAHFRPKHLLVQPNGIPDPCPEFERTVMAQRIGRTNLRDGEGQKDIVFRALFLSHCTRSKGLFDTLEAAARINVQLASAHNATRVHLDVAGSFQESDEEREFFHRIAKPDLAGAVTYHGFVSGESKHALFAEADIFLFPSHWDNCPVALIEAFAFDLPIIATRTNGVPLLFPAGYRHLIEVKNVDQLVSEWLAMMPVPPELHLREHFLECYSVDRYVQSIEQKILSSKN